MRFITFVTTGLISASVTTTVFAATPNSVATLLGPAVGYLMAQSDLCGWNMGPQIEQTYKRSFNAVGMSGVQQAAAWEQAKAHQVKLANLPAEAKQRMKADTCSTDSRQQLEHTLKD